MQPPRLLRSMPNVPRRTSRRHDPATTSNRAEGGATSIRSSSPPRPFGERQTLRVYSGRAPCHHGGLRRDLVLFVRWRSQTVPTPTPPPKHFPPHSGSA